MTSERAWRIDQLDGDGTLYSPFRGRSHRAGTSLQALRGAERCAQCGRSESSRRTCLSCQTFAVLDLRDLPALPVWRAEQLGGHWSWAVSVGELCDVTDDTSQAQTGVRGAEVAGTRFRLETIHVGTDRPETFDGLHRRHPVEVVHAAPELRQRLAREVRLSRALWEDPVFAGSYVAFQKP